jgi:hypothetical protein
VQSIDRRNLPRRFTLDHENRQSDVALGDNTEQRDWAAIDRGEARHLDGDQDILEVGIRAASR